jgi:hypothetical protein
MSRSVFKAVVVVVDHRIAVHSLGCGGLYSFFFAGGQSEQAKKEKVVNLIVLWFVF